MPAQLNFFCAALMILCAGAFLLTLWCVYGQLKEKRDRKGANFAGMKRPAGEKLRAQIELLDEKINDRIAGLILVPVVLAFALFKGGYPSLLLPVIFVGVALVAFVWVALGLLELIGRRHDCRLGFDGERYVGEELSRLVALGFVVYHDVPFGGFNIDHVAVGPKGLYAIETKTRRKFEGDTHTVAFDGEKLYWGRFTNNYGVPQATKNARTLAEWIKEKTAEEVEVSAILTVPGWQVDRRGDYDLKVLNPSEIFGACQRSAQSLTPQLVEKICQALDEKTSVDANNSRKGAGK